MSGAAWIALVADCYAKRIAHALAAWSSSPQPPVDRALCMAGALEDAEVFWAALKAHEDAKRGAPP